MTQNISVLSFSVPASLSPCCLLGEGCIALRVEATESLAPIHTVLTHHGEKTGVFQGEIKLQTSQGKQREKLYGKERHHLCNAHARECSPQKISGNCQGIENYLCTACSHREASAFDAACKELWVWLALRSIPALFQEDRTIGFLGVFHYSRKFSRLREPPVCHQHWFYWMGIPYFHLWHDTLHDKLSLLQSSQGAAAKSMWGSQWAVP